jgi:predicted TPR repeat methyltransferase
MSKTDHIANHDQYAESYDSQVKEYSSYGHDVLFGMCYEYVKPGENLLDLGIGTGLSSVHFAGVGLEITGLDGSDGMLNECRKKDFAKELKQCNIQDVPLPYKDESFSHVICCGVFHFFGNILPMIEDSVRMLKPGGIFAFTVASPQEEISSDFIEEPTAWGISLFKHSGKYINEIAKQLNLRILKVQKLLVNSGDPNADDLLFKAIVIRKEL